MSDRNLDGFDVEFLREIDRPANAFTGLAGQAKDEVTVDGKSKLVAVLGELTCALDRGALLDVLQDLRIARLEANDQEAATCFAHRLQRFVVGGNTRRAGPCQLQRLQLFAKLDGARLLNVEGIVVEEEFLYVRPDSLALAISRATASVERLRHGCPLERLWPQAERTLGGTAPRRVQRHEGVQQERYVVARNVEVALVDVDHIGQRIQIRDLRRIGIVHDAAILAIADARRFLPAACLWQNPMTE